MKKNIEGVLPMCKITVIDSPCGAGKTQKND